MSGVSGNTRHQASLRDPSGYVVRHGDEVRRIVTQAGIDDFEAVEKSGLLEKLIKSGRLWPYGHVAESNGYPTFYGFAPVRVLSHPSLPFVSYPYEWGFKLLKTAAIAHLETQLEALKAGITLKDASAYNIQFIGTQPVFIDLLSFRPYQPGEYWGGHNQFCWQFLAPLVLEATTAASPTAWYRGSPDGLDPSEVLKLIPLRAKLWPLTFLNLVLPAYLARKSSKSGGKTQSERSRQATLPRNAYESMLRNMLHGVRRLIRHQDSSVWSDYSPTTTYESTAAHAKEKFVSEAINKRRPRQVLDIGCNDGYYSSVALKAGAESVIGLEGDRSAVDRAFDRAANENLNFLPLYVNFANPSPAQGWANVERDSLRARTKSDFLQALAVVHHLVLGLNIPLEEAINVIVDFAPAGIIEFVPLTDPMAARLASGRRELFSNYTIEAFRKIVSQKAAILQEIRLPNSDRILALYQR